MHSSTEHENRIHIIELQDNELTHLGVASILDFYRTMALSCLEKPGLCAVLTGIDSPFLNVVIDTRSVKGSVEESLDEFDTFFKEAGVPWGWMKTPLAAEQELEGLFLLETVPGLYCDLTQDLPERLLPSFEIREMKTSADLALWIEPLGEGFPSEDKGKAYLQLNTRLLQKGEQKLRHFVGFYQEEAVVGGTLFTSSQAVMLHNIATKNNFRKQGYGLALSLHLMQEAKKSGFKHCFLDSSEEGFQMYKKLGFKVYCLNLFYTPSL